MKILSLDYGLKRIGVSIGNTEIGIAFTREALINNHEIIINLKKMCNDERVEKIILGYPTMLDGYESDMSKKAMKFMKDIEAQIGIDVELIKEHFTSKITAKRLFDGKCKTKKKKQIKDSGSAQVILETYFSRISH